MTGNWQKSLRDCITSPYELAEKLTIDPAPLQVIAERFPIRITRHYFNLIREVGDPIWRQCVPDKRELCTNDEDLDPLNENALSPVAGLIHRYPDRVVLIVTDFCAVYCRFCMRKRRVGCLGQGISQAATNEAIEYIRVTPAIRDVILSGGDPFLLEDDQLEVILSALRDIPHIEIIRIGTRVPVTLPNRINPRLCNMLKRYHPLYINTHFNHPHEICKESLNACSLLADAGIPLGNQTVLLNGVNDTPSVMVDLMKKLLTMRVKPYYLHQMDLVMGTSHFRTPVRTGLNIMEQLRGHTSGLAVPYFVIDLPGGKGKVPILPGETICNGKSIKFKTYTGEVVEYQDL